MKNLRSRGLALEVNFGVALDRGLPAFGIALAILVALWCVSPEAVEAAGRGDAEGAIGAVFSFFLLVANVCGLVGCFLFCGLTSVTYTRRRDHQSGS